MWSQILLVLISLFCCIVVYRRLSKFPHPEYLSYLILLQTAIMFGLMITGNEMLARTIELISVSIVLFVLIFLLISIRIIQPDYARQPVIYSYFPIVILPFYYYFIDSEILQFVTNVTIQITALLVFAGLVIRYFTTVTKGYMLFLSLISFIAALVFEWFPWFESPLLMPVIHLLIGIGMIISSFKFPSIITENRR